MFLSFIKILYKKLDHDNHDDVVNYKLWLTNTKYKKNYIIKPNLLKEKGNTGNYRM